MSSLFLLAAKVIVLLLPRKRSILYTSVDVFESIFVQAESWLLTLWIWLNKVLHLDCRCFHRCNDEKNSSRQFWCFWRVPNLMLFNAKFHYVQIFTSNRITSQMKILRNDIIEWYSDNLCANALLNKSPKIIFATRI